MHAPLTITSRSRRRLVSAALVVAIAVTTGACGSEDDQVAAGEGTTTAAPTTASPTTEATPTTAPPTTGEAPCPGEDWQTIEAGDFSFRLPPGVEDQEAQGIDSQVGQYDGAGLSVSYDYGGYTNDLSDVAATGTTEDVQVSGLGGRLITSAAADTAGYSHPFMTGLYVQTAVAGEAPPGTGAALGLSVGFDDGTLVPVADCIVRSVEFDS
jgi:hypothetical protein